MSVRIVQSKYLYVCKGDDASEIHQIQPGMSKLRLPWKTTYNCKFSVEVIIIFYSEDLVHVISRGEATRTAGALVQDSEIRVAIASEVKGCGQTKGACADNEDRVRLGGTHHSATNQSLVC